MINEIRASQCRAAQAATVAACLLVIASNVAKAQTPNVLIVLADDLGYSDLGCMGGDAETPNLDALAVNGILFPNFYNDAKCAPSRASLMTGMSNHRTGAHHGAGDVTRCGITLAEALQETHINLMIDKWHIKPKPLESGFRRYFGSPLSAVFWWPEDEKTRGKMRLDGRPYSAADMTVPVEDWYPKYYCIEPWIMRALDHHHDWIGANYVRDDETWVSTDHLIRRDKKRYMAYTKTSGRIQGLENVSAIKTQQQVLDAIASVGTIHHYCKNAAAGSPELQMRRDALTNSVCCQPDQTYSTILKPKTGEIDFPINCDPDLFSGQNMPVFGRMFLKKTEQISEQGNFNSVHWDRVGGWGNSLNYRREHFADLDHPLTFDQEGRVCIHTKLTHYELFDALRKQGKRLGVFHEAAGMKVYGWNKQSNRPAGQQNDGRFFTAAVAAGGWHEGSFKPIELGGMDFERMVVGRKSYRISSGNIVAHDEPPTLEKVKRALAQTTAYGFACPVQIQYFYALDHPRYSEHWSWINKLEHKELWERYEPANLAIRLAGWEPVTYAAADSDDVQVERFGRGDEIYLTIWGAKPPKTVSIDIDGAALGLKPSTRFEEIVSNTKMEVARISEGWRLSVPMEENMTRVIRIK